MARTHSVIYFVLASWAILVCAYDDAPLEAPHKDESKLPDSNRSCEGGISPRFAALDYWYISNCTTLANQSVLFFILVVSDIFILFFMIIIYFKIIKFLRVQTLNLIFIPLQLIDYTRIKIQILCNYS